MAPRVSAICLIRREHLALAAWVEAKGGLVEEHDGGLVDERPRDAKALAHPTAVPTYRRTGSLGEPGLGEQDARRLARAHPGVPEEPGVVAEELLAALALRVPGALGQSADALTDLGRLRVRNPGDRERAGIRFQHCREHPNRGRLAGSVRT